MTQARKTQNQQNEFQRFTQMCQLERQARQQGFRCIAGLDEAGRGPWAGPVAAAAVILPPDFYLEGVDDSKKLTAKKRECLEQDIRHMALDWSVVFLSPQKIDRLNVLEATRVAMTRAVQTLALRPDCLLLDAMSLPELSQIHQESFIKGDQKSVSIACASILAKVARDRAMVEYDKLYPGYGFVKHKGYGTKYHKECLQKLGVSSIHRLSYRPVKEVYQMGEKDEE